MGQLYDLTVYKIKLNELIEDLDLEPAVTDRLEKLNNFNLNFSTQNTLFTQDITGIEDCYKSTVLPLNQNLKRLLTQLIEKIDNQISVQVHSVIDTDSYINKWATTELGQDSLIIRSSLKFENLLDARISCYCDWKFPTLNMSRISMSGGKVCELDMPILSLTQSISSMISSDPLYLIGLSEEIKLAIEHYPTIYQNRIQIYDNIEKLPVNQFGFIFCWDYINLYRIDNSAKLLKKLAGFLRPGGTVLFSYYNCDLPKAMRLFENNEIPYCSRKLINSILDEIGLVVTNEIDFDFEIDDTSVVSFIEAKKPGKLSTVKRGQALGTIIQK